jgi:DNA-directed RNA polymerase subunit L
VKPNEYEFCVETVGVHSNEELMWMACQHLMHALHDISEQCRNTETSTFKFHAQRTLLENGIDMELPGIDHTLGCLLDTFCIPLCKPYHVNYVGFYKQHPHDTYGVLRFGGTRPLQHVDLLELVHVAANQANAVLADISSAFHHSTLAPSSSSSAPTFRSQVLTHTIRDHDDPDNNKEDDDDNDDKELLHTIQHATQQATRTLHHMMEVEDPKTT